MTPIGQPVDLKVASPPPAAPPAPTRRRKGEALVEEAPPAAPAPAWSGGVVPMLASPRLDAVDMDSLLALIGQLEAKFAQVQAITDQEQLKTEAEIKEAAVLAAQKATKEAADSAAAAKEKEQDSKAAGWTLAILGLIGSVAMIACTGGVGAAVGVVGLVMAVQEITNMGLKEGGVTFTSALGEKKGLDISIAGIVDMAVDLQVANGDIVVYEKVNGKIVDRNGKEIKPDEIAKLAAQGKTMMTQEEVDDYKLGWAIAAQVVVMVAMLAGGRAASVAGKGKDVVRLGDMLAKTAQGARRFEQGAESINAACEVGQATGGMQQSENGLQVSELQRTAAEKGAERDARRTQVAMLIEEIKQLQDQLHDLYTRLMESHEKITRSLHASAEISLNLARLPKTA